ALYSKAIGCDAIHPDYHTVIEEVIQEAKRERILVNSYTINDEHTMKKLLNWKIDGIITNYPDKLAKLIQSLK
ncbi:MAG: hypothetical protein K0R09_3572, partial [Clostridiales bacterium]|nr:hypothetical protein [Clostridiales bacterium]